MAEGELVWAEPQKGSVLWLNLRQDGVGVHHAVGLWAPTCGADQVLPLGTRPPKVFRPTTDDATCRDCTRYRRAA